jgi:protein O-GlcNAc transferase
MVARHANESLHDASPHEISKQLQAGLGAQAQGHLHEAEAAYRNVLARAPEHGDAQHLLGHVLRLQGRLDEAAATLRRRIEMAPDAPEAWYTLGDTLRAQRRFNDALEAFDAVLKLQPGFTAAWLARGDTLAALQRLDDAEDAYVQALACDPGFAEAHYNYGNLLHGEGRIDEAIAAYRRAVQLKPDFAQAGSNLVYALNFSPVYAPERIFAEHLQWDSNHAAPLAAERRPHEDPGDFGRRLRVGYVSPNFRDHAVTYFFEPTLKHHDRTRFCIYLYSDAQERDARTERLRSYGDEWRDIFGHADAAVAEQVRSDKIDILVDLTGHTDAHRLLVFARKPAPVQVTWNGYANTTGMPTMDYRITDSYADPPGATERWHVEHLVRLPEIYMAFEPPEAAPLVNVPPSQASGYVTFGSFNALAKITAQVVEAWAEILRLVPGSRLLMLTVPEGRTRTRLLDAFARHGVAQTQVKFIGRLPFAQFLAAHAKADIALDPFPFCGTTTTCHSLWMGVPLITLAGKSHASRVGVSILSNLGLNELIAENEAQYVTRAITLARDPPRLRELRMRMRERVLASPLADGRRLTRFLEDAYCRMWEDYCRKHPAN